MEALDRAPDAVRRSRSRSPDAALRLSPTTPVGGTGCEQSAVTTSSDADNALAESSCKACLSASKRLKYTCTKAKHTGKRHASPSVDARHAKRSGTAPALALMAPEGVQNQGSSWAIVSTRPPLHVPTSTLEQGEATETVSVLRLKGLRFRKVWNLERLWKVELRTHRRPQSVSQFRRGPPALTTASKDGTAVKSLASQTPSQGTAPLPSVNTQVLSILARSGYSIWLVRSFCQSVLSRSPRAHRTTVSKYGSAAPCPPSSIHALEFGNTGGACQVRVRTARGVVYNHVIASRSYTA